MNFNVISDAGCRMPDAGCRMPDEFIFAAISGFCVVFQWNYGND